MAPTVETIESVKARVVLALRHPLRVQLLRFYVEGTRSPNEVATQLRLPVGTVSYHTRVLAKTGFVELIDERKVRGAVEHFYRAIRGARLDQKEWEQLNDEERAEISCLVTHNMTSELFGALWSGKLDSRFDRHLTWHPFSLDEEGWSELMTLLLGTMKEAEEIQARSDERRIESDEEPIPTILGLMGFERGAFPE